MPVNPEDRPLDQLRAETIDRLVVNYGRGELSLAAFQRRLDAAYDATAAGELLTLTEDLELEVDDQYLARKQAAGFDESAPAAHEVDYLINVFGGGDRGGDWTVPREIRVFCLCGGADLDFSAARFTQRTTRVRIFCLFGGVDVFVPEGSAATVRTFNLFGGTTNKAPGTAGPEAPRLVIDGVVLFGGVDVKVRRTLKERMLALAEGLRALFAGQAQPH